MRVSQCVLREKEREIGESEGKREEGERGENGSERVREGETDRRRGKRGIQHEHTRIQYDIILTAHALSSREAAC